MRRRLRDLEHAIARARVHGLAVDRSLQPHGPEWFQRVSIPCPCCGIAADGREVQRLILFGDKALGMVRVNGELCPGCHADDADIAELLLGEPASRVTVAPLEPASSPPGLWAGRVRMRRRSR